MENSVMVPLGVTRATRLSSPSVTQILPSDPVAMPPRYEFGEGRLYDASGAIVGHGHCSGVWSWILLRVSVRVPQAATIAAAQNSATPNASGGLCVMPRRSKLAK